MARKRRRSTTRRDPQVTTRSVPSKRTRFATSSSHQPATFAPASHQARGPLVPRGATFSSEPAKPSPRAARAKLAKLYQAVPGALVCAKRHIRKQVLHALGKAGKRGQRRPRFTLASKVKCT